MLLKLMKIYVDFCESGQKAQHTQIIITFCARLVITFLVLKLTLLHIHI